MLASVLGVFLAGSGLFDAAVSMREPDISVQYSAWSFLLDTAKNEPGVHAWTLRFRIKLSRMWWNGHCCEAQRQAACSRS